MRRVRAALFFLLLFTVFNSCNKEKSFEVGAPAHGSLQSDATGDCLPKTAVGAFIAGTALTDSNYLEVDVNVSSAGAYDIRTDTVNGYSFSGIGNFDHTGVNHIRLAAAGTPTAAGENSFSVIYDTSFCLVPVTVLPAGSNSGPAAFTLQGSGDTCMLATVSGNYVQNAPLNGTNTVAIKVNVTTPGTYTVTTDNKNEFQFAGSGTLAAPGVQNIMLTATGTPAIEGATVFTVSAGSTTCTFTVNVTASTGPPPVGDNPDHFPLTTNSYWIYADDPLTPQDATVVTNTKTTTIGTDTYNSFEFGNGDGEPAFDIAYYRKDGTDYYAYHSVDYYTNAPFDTDIEGAILFLKENLQTNQSWNSAEFSGTTANIPVKVQFVFTCTDANASFVINGTTYNNIYKVVAKPQVSVSGGPYTPTGEEVESYYAKGIGLIYQKSSAGGSVDFESFLINYKVN